MWSPGRKWRIMYQKSWPRPSWGVPGSLVPAYVHTVTGNHLYGGHPGWRSSTPRGPQLGHSGIHDPVICSSDSGAGCSEWVRSSYHCRECSNARPNSNDGECPVHAYTSGREYDGSHQVISRKADPEGWHGEPSYLLREQYRLWDIIHLPFHPNEDSSEDSRWPMPSLCQYSQIKTQTTSNHTAAME